MSSFDVDASPDPTYFADYLRKISAESEITRYKRAALAKLELKPGEHVLDVGCGLAQDTAVLAQLVGPGGRAVGFDASETLLAQARAQHPQLELVRGDIASLPFPDASFDVVRTDRVLIHVVDPAAAMAEMARVLKPGGRLVLTEGDWGALEIDAEDRRVTRRIMDFACDHAFKQGWVGRALPRLARRAGLMVLDVEGVTLVFNDFAAANALWLLDQAALGAAAAGQITEAEARAWLDDLATKSAAGEFACFLTGFGIRARKP